MNKRDLKHFEKKLLAERERLALSLGKLESSVLKRTQRDSSGDLSAYSIHMADLGTDAMEREKDLQVASAEGRLLTEIDDNDLTYFILHQLDIITRAIEDLHHWLARKAAESAQFHTAIAATRGLNHRQRALLIHAAKHPQQVYTIASHRQSHGVAYATARADLLQLAEANWLVQHTRGRKMEFLPGPKLRHVRDAL